MKTNRQHAKEYWNCMKPGICSLSKFSDSTGTWLLFWELYDENPDRETCGDWVIAMLERQLEHVKNL